MTQGSISTKCALKKKDKQINDYIALLLVHINRQSNFRISSFMKVLYTFHLSAFEINLIAIRLDKNKSTILGGTRCHCK